MRATYLLSALFACSVAAGSSGIHAFKKADKVLERRNAERQKPAAPKQDTLQKRASAFLNDATQGGCLHSTHFRQR